MPTGTVTVSYSLGETSSISAPTIPPTRAARIVLPAERSDFSENKLRQMGKPIQNKHQNNCRSNINSKDFEILKNLHEQCCF